MRPQDILPKKFRSFLLKKYQQLVWPAYFKDYQQLIEEGKMPDEAMLKKLVFGWGNQSFSAQVNYLQTMIGFALKTNGVILECGSGLSTLLVGVIAKKRNVQMYSLEHFPFWAQRVQQAIDKYDLTSNYLYLAPLKTYGLFEWYDINNINMDDIGLCICDAPPGNTTGGRKGLLYVLLNKMLPNAVILVDDTSREAEQEMIEEWKSLCGFTVTFSGVIDPHAILVLK